MLDLQCHVLILSCCCVTGLPLPAPLPQVLGVLLEETHRPEMHLAVISTLAVRSGWE